MRFNKYSFLIVLGLVLTIGLSTALAAGGGDSTSGVRKLTKEEKRRLKTEGILSIKSSPAAYPVLIDGKDAGMTGVGVGREFFLAPGFHIVEVLGPDGKTAWKEEVEIRRGMRNCVCVKAVPNTVTKACPYRFHLEGPASVQEGQLVTFTAVPDVMSPVPLRYGWSVSNGRVTSGLGTPTITVDSANMGGKTIDAELDVNDDVYDGRCRQVISVPTEIIPVKEPPPPTPFICDQFEPGNRDQDKARFDNCVIQVQNTPDAQLFVYIYPGTDKVSVSRYSYERTSKFYLDYIVKNRQMPPDRVRMVKGSARTRTSVVIWVVPPGATPPPVE